MRLNTMQTLCTMNTMALCCFSAKAVLIKIKSYIFFHSQYRRYIYKPSSGFTKTQIIIFNKFQHEKPIETYF